MAANSSDKCKHESTIKSCGIKVCFDCGMPLNAKAIALANTARKVTSA